MSTTRTTVPKAIYRTLLRMGPPGRFVIRAFSKNKSAVSPLPSASAKTAPPVFESTGAYWEERYKAGRNSGPGSYGDVATFKAEALSALIERQGIHRVIELGCGDGHQLGLLKAPEYVGLDISPAVIEANKKLYADDPTKSFIAIPDGVVPAELASADLTLSLDVIYHVMEDDLYDAYMRSLFDLSTRWVAIFAVDEEGELLPGGYMRYRKFTDWIQANAPEWKLAEVVDNPHKGSASVADFFYFERRP